MDNKLLQAYLNTHYTVYPTEDDHFVIKINQPNPRLKFFLQEHAATSWAFLTAWNPYSQRTTTTENAQRNARLRTDLEKYQTFAAAGVPAKNNWESETSFFILDIPETVAVQLAKKYEQNALVYGTAGNARLVWT